MDRQIAAYYKHCRRIEEMFDAYERNPHTKEFDADWIEEVLLEWEQFIDDLRQIEWDGFADEVYEQSEIFHEMLSEIHEKATDEDEEAVADANQRLGQDAICNYLDHQLKRKYMVHSSLDEHQARQRLHDKIQMPPPPSRLTRNRLSLDED